MASSRIAFLLFVCVVPAMVMAIRPNKNPFCLKGRVYCDPCRAGFETSAITYVSGAEVALECKKRTSNEVVYTKTGRTDPTGEYTIYVDEDRTDDVCDVKLVNSHQHGCVEATPGRDQARVVLTRYNGIASNYRYANTMGFMADEVASGCGEVLKQLQDLEDEN